jgi:hypothetical protein
VFRVRGEYSPADSAPPEAVRVSLREAMLSILAGEMREKGGKEVKAKRGMCRINNDDDAAEGEVLRGLGGEWPDS